MSPLTRPCPHCGATLPAEAQFCGNCGASLPPLVEKDEEKKRAGLVVLPPIPGGEGTATPSLSAAAQTGAPGLPGMSAAPQSAAPGVPSLPAGPQWGAPSVPTLPGAAQTGSTVMQGATRVAGRGLRQKLLGTVAGKILTGVLAVVVVAGGTTAVLAARGVKLPFVGSGGSGASQASGAHPTSTSQSSPTSGAGPNGAPPNAASFKITMTLTIGSAAQLPGNPEKLLLVKGGTVCGPHDTGQPFSYPSSNPGVTYSITKHRHLCSGW